MASLIALLVIIAVSYVVVTVAGTMLELTGMERAVARFEALSAFSGTGFSTRNSELIVRHPVRRRIATALMILGNAGTASLVASLIGTFHAASMLELILNTFGLLAIAVGAAWAVRRFGEAFGDVLRRFLSPAMTADQVTREELMLFQRGYGLMRIEVHPDSRLNGVCLRDAGLRENHLEVLAVEDGANVQPVPTPGWVFRPGQWVLVYGETGRVEQAFGAVTPPTP